jgi:signal recognition particle GTPase
MTENESKDVNRFVTPRARRNRMWADMLEAEMAHVKVMTNEQVVAFLDANSGRNISVHANHAGSIMRRLVMRGVVEKSMDTGSRSGLVLYHYIEPQV